MEEKKLEQLADWLNNSIIDCVLFIEKNPDSPSIPFYEGFQSALESTIDKMGQLTTKYRR